MTLLDTHIGFVEALRSAGLPVSLAEGLDAIAALERIGWHRPRGGAHGVRRHPGQAAVPARHLRRGLRPLLPAAGRGGRRRRTPSPTRATGPRGTPGVRDNADALRVPRGAGGGAGGRRRAARAGPGRRGGGALRRDARARAGPVELVGLHRAAAGDAPGAGRPAGRGAAGAGGDDEPTPSGSPARRIGDVHPARRGRRPAAASPRRRGPSTSPTSSLRPTIDRLDFTAARRSRPRGDAARDLPAGPAARRTADQGAARPAARRARLPAHGARVARRPAGCRSRPTTGPSGRTAPSWSCSATSAARWPASRSSRCCWSTRCGSVPQGARVHLRRRRRTRSPTTSRPGGDVVEVMEDLAASTAHAALWGRTNYGRAFTRSPRSTPTPSGRGRRCSCWATRAPTTATWRCAVLRDLAGRARHAWWLNPEHARHWGTGDSAARAYGEIVPMVECRNLAQLGEFVHDDRSDGGVSRRGSRAPGCGRSRRAAPGAGRRRPHGRRRRRASGPRSPSRRRRR